MEYKKMLWALAMMFFIMPLARGDSITVGPGVQFVTDGVYITYNTSETMSTENITVEANNMTWNGTFFNRTAPAMAVLDFFQSLFRATNGTAYLTEWNLVVDGPGGYLSTWLNISNGNQTLPMAEGTFDLQGTKVGYGETSLVDISFSSIAQDFTIEFGEAGGADLIGGGGGGGGGASSLYSLFTAGKLAELTFEPSPLNILAVSVPVKKQILVKVWNNGNLTFNGLIKPTSNLKNIMVVRMCEFANPVTDCVSDQFTIKAGQHKIMLIDVLIKEQFTLIEGQISLEGLNNGKTFPLTVSIERLPGFSLLRTIQGWWNTFTGWLFPSDQAEMPLEMLESGANEDELRPLSQGRVLESMGEAMSNKALIYGIIGGLLIVVLFWKQILALLGKIWAYVLSLGIWGILLIILLILVLYFKYAK